MEPEAAAIKDYNGCPDWCGSVGGMSSHNVKGHQFNSQWGHMPGWQVWSPVGVCTRRNQSMFVSHIDVSPPHFFPPFYSL